MRSRWAPLLLALVVLPPVVAAPGGRTYRVAIDAEFAPYEFVSARGSVSGMVPELLRAIGASAGVEFEFLPMDWPDAIAALDRGDVELVNMLRTPARAERYEFSAPHGHVTQALFRNARHRDIENVAGIAGSRVALQRGDVSLEALADRTDFQRVLVSSKEEGFMLLDTGLVAAFFVAEQPGLAYLHAHGLANVELVETGLFPRDYCFAARKGNVALISLLNQGLANLQRTGRFDDIVLPWLSTPPSWLQRHRSQVLVAVGLLLAVALANVLWNVQLRRIVRRRTAELSEEHDRLQESEAHRQLLYEQCPIGLALSRPDGTFVDVNQAFADILGRSIQEIVGLDSEQITAPEFHDETARQRRELEAHGRYGPYEKEILHADGHRIAVRRTGVLIESRGEQFVWSTLEDVSERERSERQVEQLAHILELTSDFVAISEPDGAIRYLNAAGRRMLGLPADEALPELRFSDLYAETEGNRVERDLFPRVAGAGVHQADCALRHTDGTEIPVSAVFIAHRTAGNGPVATFSVIARDLTAERDMQARLEHGQRLESMGVLAGGIAHDFNNILTVILGNAAMAERSVSASPVDARRYLANIVSSSEQAAELCRQMLAYAGKGRFIVRAVDLSEVVGEVSRLLEVSITKNVVLRYHLADDLPPVEVDVAQIQQVVMNLVINASDAIGDRDGIISVTTGETEADREYLAGSVVDDRLEPGRYVFLEVADTGGGMDRKTQERVFEPFFTTKFAGHGLGMSAVLGIVRGHRGAIRVYTEVGRGSSFKVLLPANQAATKDATSREEEPATDSQRLAGTVLVVDDEESVRTIAAAMLEDMGFATLLAVDGTEAIRIYGERHREIAAVLLDMTMPRMDGKTCYAGLRRIDRGVRVVLSSGYSEEQAIAQFPGNGFEAGFIQKPYTPDELREKMREAITRDD